MHYTLDFEVVPKLAGQDHIPVENTGPHIQYALCIDLGSTCSKIALQSSTGKEHVLNVGGIDTSSAKAQADPLLPSRVAIDLTDEPSVIADHEEVAEVLKGSDAVPVPHLKILLQAMDMKAEELRASLQRMNLLESFENPGPGGAKIGFVDSPHGIKLEVTQGQESMQILIYDAIFEYLARNVEKMLNSMKLDQELQFDRSQVKYVVFATPTTDAGWSEGRKEAYRTILIRLCRELFGRELPIYRMSEPFAACLGGVMEHLAAPGHAGLKRFGDIVTRQREGTARVVMVDVGGSSTDIAIVEATYRGGETSVELVEVRSRSIDYAGLAFNHALKLVVQKRLIQTLKQVHKVHGQEQVLWESAPTGSTRVRGTEGVDWVYEPADGGATCRVLTPPGKRAVQEILSKVNIEELKQRLNDGGEGRRGKAEFEKIRDSRLAGVLVNNELKQTGTCSIPLSDFRTALEECYDESLRSKLEEFQEEARSEEVVAIQLSGGGSHSAVLPSFVDKVWGRGPDAERLVNPPPSKIVLPRRGRGGEAAARLSVLQGLCAWSYLHMSTDTKVVKRNDALLGVHVFNEVDRRHYLEILFRPGDEFTTDGQLEAAATFEVNEDEFTEAGDGSGVQLPLRLLEFSPELGVDPASLESEYLTRRKHSQARLQTVWEPGWREDQFIPLGRDRDVAGGVEAAARRLGFVPKLELPLTIPAAAKAQLIPAGQKKGYVVTRITRDFTEAFKVELSSEGDEPVRGTTPQVVEGSTRDAIVLPGNPNPRHEERVASAALAPERASKRQRRSNVHQESAVTAVESQGALVAANALLKLSA